MVSFNTRAAWQTQHVGLVTVTVGAGGATPVYGGGGDTGDSINTSGSTSIDTLDVEWCCELSSAIVDSAISATGGSTRGAECRRRMCPRCRCAVFGTSFGDGIGSWSPLSKGRIYTHTNITNYPLSKTSSMKSGIILLLVTVI